ncbi:MAG: tyrosine-type recombinase/integrase [Deltaproteobacteria bacterium]|nr:tyrosine-type recombinase/integrase [Deltaproteobacteria bacterium]
MASTSEGRVYKRGSAWWIDFSINGRRIRERAGPTKETAKALLAKRKVETFEGKNFPEKLKRDLTVGQLRDLWLAHATEKGKATVSNDRQRLGTIVEILGTNRRVSDLTSEDIEALKRKLRGRPSRRRMPTAEVIGVDGQKRNGAAREFRPLGPASVNRHLTVLRSALRLVRKTHPHNDPMAGVAMETEPNPRGEEWTQAQYEALRDAADERLRVAIILAYSTGARCGELAKLPWSRVDLEAGIVTFEASTTKTKRTRMAPLNSDAIGALKAWRTRQRENGSPIPMSDPVIGLNPNLLSNGFRRLRLKLGFTNIVLHSARNAVVSALERAGIGDMTAGAIVGHSLVETRRRYLVMQAQDIRNASERMEKVRAGK